MRERYCITVTPCPDIIWGNGVPPKIFGGSAFPLDYATDVTIVTHMMDWLREYSRGLTYQTLVNAFDNNLFTVTKGMDSDLCDRMHFVDDDD